MKAATAEDSTMGAPSRSRASIISTSSSSRPRSRRHILGTACAAAFLTCGLGSRLHARMARMTTGTMTWTRMEERTRRAEARTRGDGWLRSFWKVLTDNSASSGRNSA